MKHYNYIFAGSGLSALMTVYKIVQSGKFSDKSILLLDENSKKSNDRTWCFWSEKNENWEPIINKKWNSALFANQDFKIDINLNPYKYNQIRGLDFYNFVFDVISKQENITFVNQKVIDYEESENQAQTYEGIDGIKTIMNDMIEEGAPISAFGIPQEMPDLLQHF